MRLLIVEDDRDLREFLQESLSREGFNVDHCVDGREALERVGLQPYDGVLLDVVTPGLDGYQVLRALRENHFAGAILLVTGYGQERDKLEGLASGADDYVVKPFSVRELTARIKAVLRWKKPGIDSCCKPTKPTTQIIF